MIRQRQAGEEHFPRGRHPRRQSGTISSAAKIRAVGGFGVFHLMTMSRAFVGQRLDQAHLALVGLQGLTQRREDPMLVFRPIETGFS